MAWTLRFNAVRNPKTTIKMFDLLSANQAYAVEFPDYAQDDRAQFAIISHRASSNFSGLLPTVVYSVEQVVLWERFTVIYPATATIGGIWVYVPENGIKNLRIRGYRFDP
jgi:hypothetical protein